MGGKCYKMRLKGDICLCVGERDPIEKKNT